MKKIIYLFVCLAFVPTKAQEKSDFEQIKTSITNYYEGYIERDSTKLYQAFDIENGTLKVPKKENNQIVGFENRYFKNVLPVWSNRPKLEAKILENCALTFLTIDVENNEMATAKIKMKVDTITYIDILSLQKIKNEWRITNKMYVVE